MRPKKQVQKEGNNDSSSGSSSNAVIHRYLSPQHSDHLHHHHLHSNPHYNQHHAQDDDNENENARYNYNHGGNYHMKSNRRRRRNSWTLLWKRLKLKLFRAPSHKFFVASLSFLLVLYSLISSFTNLKRKKTRFRVSTNSNSNSNPNRPRPRTMACYFTPAGPSIIKTKPLPTHVEELYPSKRIPQEWNSGEETKRKNLLNSKFYRRAKPDVLERGECEAQHPWQLQSFPSCNLVHERDLAGGVVLHRKKWRHRWDIKHLHEDDSNVDVRIVDNGFWRDVWMVRDVDWEDADSHAHTTSSNNGGKTVTNPKRALKTMRWEHEYEERNYDRHRRDALTMERLTSSPNVVNIYAFCGNTGIYDYAAGGSLSDVIWPDDLNDATVTPTKHQNDTVTDADDTNTINNGGGGGGGCSLTPLEKLEVARQVALGIRDLHNVDSNFIPSVAHTDIAPSQFILVDGMYKLNDFNRCRFITWNRNKNEPCPYHVGRNPGTFRSPEEYAYTDQSEKVDIYSMGNVFYSLLTEYWPFEFEPEKKAQKQIVNGERPAVDEKIRNSTNVATSILVTAMEMCWIQDPVQRPSAVQILEVLEAGLDAIRSEAHV